MFDLEKFKQLCSETPSNWREEAEWRLANREWLRISGAVAVAFMTEHGTGQESREHIINITGWDIDRADLFMKGQADLTLSEICKLIGHERFAQLMCDLIFLEFNKLKEKEYATD